MKADVFLQFQIMRHTARSKTIKYNSNTIVPLHFQNPFFNSLAHARSSTHPPSRTPFATGARENKGTKYTHGPTVA